MKKLLVLVVAAHSPLPARPSADAQKGLPAGSSHRRQGRRSPRTGSTATWRSRRDGRRSSPSSACTAARSFAGGSSAATSASRWSVGRHDGRPLARRPNARARRDTRSPAGDRDVTPFALIDTRTLAAPQADAADGTWSYDAISPDGSVLYLIEYERSGRALRTAFVPTTSRPAGCSRVRSSIGDRREAHARLGGHAQDERATAAGRTRSTRARRRSRSSTRSTRSGARRTASTCRST